MLEKTIVRSRFGDYPVAIGEGLDFGALALEAKGAACRAIVVSDDNVFPLHGGAVTKSLAEAGFDVGSHVIENGEASKTLGTVSRLLGFLADAGLTRRDVLFALGGGVVGDVAGFAAAVYLRGVGFFQLPTTTLAAVDSSVGGKTGVDLPIGKNLVGAFHGPLGVFCDVGFFSTLSRETFADGMAEAVKHGMIADADMLRALGKTPIAEVCRRNVAIKAAFVENDELDAGVRGLLNFGHTVGHAIELLSDYGVPHGNAVAIGMTVITRAAEKGGLTESPCLGELRAALRRQGLPDECPFSAPELAAAAMRDKKRSGDSIALVVPVEVGRARFHEIPVSRLEAFIASGLEE